MTEAQKSTLFRPGEEEQSEEDKEADALSWLQDQTQVIEFEGGVIIASF